MVHTSSMTAQEIVEKVEAGELDATTYDTVEDFLKAMRE